MNKKQPDDQAADVGAKGIPPAEISKKEGVVICGKGSKTKQDGETIESITQEINEAMGKLWVQHKADNERVMSWSLDKLLDHISNTHHPKNRKNAEVIYDLAQKVAYQHSEAHPELKEVVSALFLFMHDLLNHMMREEQILFPNIKQLLKNNNQTPNGRFTTFGIIKEWVQLMQKEHRSSYSCLKHLNKLTHNYSAPPDASEGYQTLLRLLQEFESGFLKLMYIENNILFPKALAEDGEQT